MVFERGAISMRKLDVLFFSHTADYSGAEKSLLNMIRALEPAIASPMILLPSKGKFTEVLRASGYDFHVGPVPTVNKTVLPHNLLIQYIEIVRFRKFLHGFLAEHRSDIIHANSVRAAYLCGPVASKLGIPLIYNNHDLIKDRPVNRLFVKHASRNARFILTYRACRDSMIRLGVSPDRIVVFGNGVNIEDFQFPDEEVASLRRELGHGNDQIVTMVGQLVRWKGWHILMEAIPLVLEEFPSTSFLMVGDTLNNLGLHYKESLLSLVRRLGIGGNVSFLGHRSDIEKIMKASDILVHASIEPEPFGIVIIEGMAAGIPVVASDLGGPREIVVHGDTGLLVPPANPALLAHAVKQLLGNTQLRTAMGNRGTERVRKLFSTNQFNRGLLSFYSSITLLKVQRRPEEDE